MTTDEIDKLMDKWWEEKHKGDLRMSGEFCWDEIKECVEFIQEQTNQNIKKFIEELKEIQEIYEVSILGKVAGCEYKTNFPFETFMKLFNETRIIYQGEVDELTSKYFPQIGNHNSLSDTEESNSLDNVPSKDKIMNNSEQDVISNCKYFNRSVSEVNNQILDKIICRTPTKEFFKLENANGNPVSEVNNQEIMEFLKKRGWKEGVYNLNRRKNNE